MVSPAFLRRGYLILQGKVRIPLSDLQTHGSQKSLAVVVPTVTALIHSHCCYNGKKLRCLNTVITVSAKEPCVTHATARHHSMAVITVLSSSWGEENYSCCSHSCNVSSRDILLNCTSDLLEAKSSFGQRQGQEICYSSPWCFRTQPMDFIRIILGCLLIFLRDRRLFLTISQKNARCSVVLSFHLSFTNSFVPYWHLWQRHSCHKFSENRQPCKRRDPVSLMERFH